MSPKMISFLILIWISFQVKCSAPDYCDSIKTNGKFSGLKIYRHFEGDDYKNYTLRVYNEHNEFEVEFRDTYLKFIRTLTRNKPVRYKFSFNHKRVVFRDEYLVWEIGLANCEVYPSDKDISTELKTNCTSPNARFPDFQIKRDYPNEAVFVNLIPIVYVMVFDRNDRKKWYYYDSDHYSECNEESYQYMESMDFMEWCQMPKFIKELNGFYFNHMEGILIDVEPADKRNNLILFNIDGRPKYCITSDENLSEECNSSEKMKTLFEECFTTPTQSTKPIGQTTKPLETTELIEDSTKLLETPEPTEDSNDPKLIVFIVQIIVTIFLMIGVVWVACYKYGPIWKTQDSAEKTKSESESSELERERRNNETLIKSAETVASEVTE